MSKFVDYSWNNKSKVSSSLGNSQKNLLPPKSFSNRNQIVYNNNNSFVSSQNINTPKKDIYKM